MIDATLPSYKREEIIWDSPLTKDEKYTLLALNTFVDGNGECWPGNRRLSKMMSVPVSTMKRYISSLEEKGVVTRKRRYRKDGGETSSGKRIDFEAIAALTPSPPVSHPQLTSEPGGVSTSEPPPSPPVSHQELSNRIHSERTYSSTTRAKPRKEGGGSELAPLLDSEGINAKEIAEWLCSEYWYHQMGSAEPLRFNCTRYLVDACKGHTKATARDAMLAFWEAMLGYVDINESINKPERFLAMRLKDREPLSAGNRERVLQYEQEIKARYHRKSAADYNRRWLAHAESAGILLDVRINEADQFYSFWYGDTGEPGNLNLWDLPPRYAHLTIDQLMKVPA